MDLQRDLADADGGAVFANVLLMHSQFHCKKLDAFVIEILERAIQELGHRRPNLKDTLLERLFNSCRLEDERAMEIMYRACSQMQTRKEKARGMLRQQITLREDAIVKREKYIKIYIDELVRTRNVAFLRTRRFEDEDIEVFMRNSFARIDGLARHREEESRARMPRGLPAAAVCLHQLRQKLPGLTLPEVEREEISQQLTALKTVGLIFFDGGAVAKRRLSSSCHHLWSLFKTFEKTLSVDVADVQDRIETNFENMGFMSQDEDAVLAEVEVLENQLFNISQTYVDLQNQIAQMLIVNMQKLGSDFNIIDGSDVKTRSRTDYMRAQEPLSAVGVRMLDAHWSRK